jgi:hypothetical protein
MCFDGEDQSAAIAEQNRLAMERQMEMQRQLLAQQEAERERLRKEEQKRLLDEEARRQQTIEAQRREQALQADAQAKTGAAAAAPSTSEAVAAGVKAAGLPTLESLQTPAGGGFAGQSNLLTPTLLGQSGFNVAAPGGRTYRFV